MTSRRLAIAKHHCSESGCSPDCAAAGVMATTKHQRSQSGCSPERGAPGVMAGRSVQNLFRGVLESLTGKRSTTDRCGSCDPHLPCKLDAGRRSRWRTAGRCDARTQSCMMTGHLYGSQSPPVVWALLLTAWWSWARVLFVPWRLGDEVKHPAPTWARVLTCCKGGGTATRWRMEDLWWCAPSSRVFSSDTRCRLLALWAASVGGPWLAASQSQNAGSREDVPVHTTCWQLEDWRSYLFVDLIFRPHAFSCCTTLFLIARRTTLTILPYHGPELMSQLQDLMTDETCCQYLAARCSGKSSQSLALLHPGHLRVCEPEALMAFDVSGIQSDHLISIDSGCELVLLIS